MFFTFPVLVSWFSFIFFSVMPMSSGASTPSRSGGLRYVPFTLDVFLSECKDYLETSRLDAMPSNGDAKTIYNTRNGFDRDMASGAWSLFWAQWGGRCAVLLNKNFDVSTCRLYGVKKNTATHRD